MNLKHVRNPQLIPGLKTAEDKATVEVRITALEDGGAVGSSLAEDISDLEDDVDDLQTDVTQLETDVQTASTGLLDRATELEARAEFLTGATAPDDEDDGKNGDLWLDTVAGEFYLKAAGVWTSMGTLVPAI